jgi:hypothetical protein
MVRVGEVDDDGDGVDGDRLGCGHIQVTKSSHSLELTDFRGFDVIFVMVEESAIWCLRCENRFPTI